MRSTTTWIERQPVDSDGNRPAIVGIAYRPDGVHIIAAVGHRVHVYDAATGDLLHSLRGHKDTVNAVDYGADGKQFASGGCDKMVILWTSRGEGMLKYQHSDPVQSVTFNPVTGQLLSITAGDFGLWSATNKNVSKHKLPSKGMCGAWTADGQHCAIGMFGGSISIRNKGGEEKNLIKRSAPIYCLTWNADREDGSDVLSVGSWDRKLSFYYLNGKQIGKDRDIGFDPCSITCYTNGNYLLVAGSDKKVSLYTRDGTFLVNLAEAADWVWAVRQRPKHSAIALATNDGTVAAYQLQVSVVHSIYSDQYVYREPLTDVCIQRLTVDQRLRIPCKDYVRKVAVYRDRLAVQLNEKIVIYELFYDDQYELKYRVRERINKKLECTLLCVTSSNIVLCQGTRLTSYDFHGVKRREWVVESFIRYIKVVGGLAEREALLVGLKNGAVLKVFVDNAFPTQLVKLAVPIRCLDLSASRTKLAVVDENSTCIVYNLRTKEQLYSEANANAVAWNTDHEDILCYSGNGMLSIKTGTLPPYQQKLMGFVVGFKGNKVFCLHSSSISTVDVPHSHALHRYVEQKDFAAAYRIACLGVTEDDWKMLGMHAMTQLELDIARKAFIRIREVKFVELLNRVELDRRVSGGDDSFLLGDILAFQGKYQEAARCFIRSGLDQRAIEMFCDMKMWAEAKKVCSNDEHLKELIRRQARWAEDVGDLDEAAKLWLAAGDHGRAIELFGSRGTMDALVTLSRQLPKQEQSHIRRCGQIFREKNDFPHAVECFERIDDHRALLQLHVDMQHWQEAFQLLERFPQYVAEVYVPYAAYLAVNDRFEEAQEAFRKAKRPQEALRMMEQLAANAVVTKRFTDAAFYFYKLAQDTVSASSIEGEIQMREEARQRRVDKQRNSSASPSPTAAAAAAKRQLPSGSSTGALEEEESLQLQPIVRLSDDDISQRIERHDALLRRAELYYTYHLIHSFISQPFTSYEPTEVFHAALSVLATLAEYPDVPMNISKLDVLLALGRLANNLDMCRLARQVHEKLQQYVLPPSAMEQIDLETLVMRGRPFQDQEELLPTCYRCGKMNAALVYRCTFCLHPFVRSLKAFEVLPLVEFAVVEELADAEAERIIMTGGGGAKRVQQHTQQEGEGGPDVITFNDDIVDKAMGEGSDAGDPFAAFLMQLELQGRSEKYKPIQCNAEALKKLKSDDVFIVKREYNGLGMPWRYYRNMMPGRVTVTMSPCGHFFRDGEYEFETLKQGHAPFSRAKVSM